MPRGAAIAKPTSMPQLIVTGIVTRYVNYKDNDRILTLFTKEHGRIDAKAPGCRRQKSKLNACAQHFVYGEFQLYVHANRYSVRECDIRETFYPLREDIHKLEAASSMLAFSQQSVQEGEPAAALFSLLYYGLSFLAYGQIHALDMALCFALRFLDIMGLCPVLTSCALCAQDLRRQTQVGFLPAAGGAICARCANDAPGALQVSALCMEAARRMLQMENARMDTIVLPDGVRRELYALLKGYCEYHFGKENKAFAVLRGMLA